MIVRDPFDLERIGLEVVPHCSLLETEDFLRWRHIQDRWIQRIPHLRTPYREGGLPPGEHQIKYSSMGLSRRHNLYLWTVGTGKTCLSIMHILGWYGEQLFPGINWEELSDDERRKAMLEAVPSLPAGAIHIVTRKKILKKTWMSELKRMGIDHLAEVIESEDRLRKSTAPIFLYHFEFPSRIQTDRGRRMRAQGQGKRLKSDGKLYFRGEPMGKLITKLRPPSLLIVDEIHRLREGTAITQELTHIRKKARRVLGLTATPMDGWLIHYGTVLQFVYGPNSPMFPYSSASDFARRYAKNKVVTQDIVTGGETVGKKRPMPGVHPMQVPQFVRVTRHLAHRMTSKDPEVKKNVKFPPANFYRVLVDMDPRQELFYRDLYAQHQRELAMALAEASGRGLSRAKARQNMLKLINQLRFATACPTVLGYDGPDIEKFARCLEVCQRAKAEGRKVIIYTSFIEESREITRYLRDHGIGVARLYVEDAKASPKHLKEDVQMDLIDQHEDDDDTTVLVSNLELIAEGLTLTWASVLIYLSPGWRGNLYAQGLGRAIRPGQVWDWVDVYELITSGSVEMYISSMLKNKQKATAAFVDQDFSHESSGTELDVFELTALLSQGVAA